MQITASPSLQGGNVVLQVKRGIWGTAKSTHAANSKVLSPAYIGSTEMNGTPSKNDPNASLRYVIKFWLPDGYRWQANRILRTLGDGRTVADGGKLVHYDTVWLDVSSCSQYNIADPYTSGIEVWDDLAGSRMTKDNWGKYQRWKLNGQNESGGGLRDLVKHQNPAVKVKFTGNSMLKLASDSCNTGLLSNLYDGGSLEGWLKGNFDDQMALGFAIQKNNWPGLFWVRDDASYGGPVPNGKKFTHRRFTYGSYLLAYNKNATNPQYGLTWGLNKPDNIYFYDFGDASQTVNSLADLSIGDGLYSRQYSKGLVVVNSSDSSKTYTLNKSYYRIGGVEDSKADLDSAPQAVKGSITIGPKDAALLLNPNDSAPGDTQVPTTPINLEATNVTDSSINIKWTGSTDNVGVTGYKIFRNEVQVGSVITTDFNDTNLLTGTTYSYKVLAFDAAGNSSAQSISLNVTTQSQVIDAIPSVTIDTPRNGEVVGGVVNMTATAQDDKGVSKVEFVADGTIVGTDTTAPYTIGWNSETFANGNHNLKAIVFDAANQQTSTSISVVTQNGDTQAPSMPTNIAAQATEHNKVSLSWTAATDNIGLAGYWLVRNGVTVAKLGPVSGYVDSNVNADSKYTYYLIAFDEAGNNSHASTTVSITTPSVPDTTDPSAPLNLIAMPVSSTQINLSWSASSDNIGVVAYDVYRDNIKIATVSGTSFGDGSLNASTSYNYYVESRDAAGNSSTSVIVRETTKPKEAITGIVGTVRSSKGGVVVGAKVTIIGNWYAATFSTNSAGVYQIPNLKPGSYILFVTVSNYWWQIERGITITSDTVTTRDITVRRFF